MLFIIKPCHHNQAMPNVERICQSCGKKFSVEPNLVKSGRGKFCGRVCHTLSQRGNRTPEERLRECKEYARSKGGKCNSTEYKSFHSKLDWECAKGHCWKSSYKIVWGNRWCPICNGTPKLSLDFVKKFVAEKYGGKCLSEEYNNIFAKLDFECAQGDRFSATLNNVKNHGRWCPSCSKGIHERLCRKNFEAIFGAKFPNSHPEWLRSKRGESLELDGYCEKLKLAFEYQGKHHVIYIPYYFKTMTFERRQEYDQTKRELCKRNDITLIEIPHTVKPEDFREFILSKCKEGGIAIPTDQNERQFSYSDAYNPKRMQELEDMAKNQGLRILSQEYHGMGGIYEYRCLACSYVGRKTGQGFLRTGCYKCGNEKMKRTKKRSLEYLNSCLKGRHIVIATENYNEYKTTNTRIWFTCAVCGWRWKTTFGSVKAGTGCPKCNRKKSIAALDEYWRTKNVRK